MSKEFQIRDGNLIASFDLENEDGDIDFCKLLKVSHGVADEIGMFVDYVATNKIMKDQSKKIAGLGAKLEEKDREITNVYPFLKEYDNGVFTEYNVVYERDGIVATTCFGKNKEMAYEYLKTLRNDIKPVLTTTQIINQDKISFAIAELEKVKSAFGLINSKLDKVETIKEYIHYIDHQINELKEMK